MDASGALWALLLVALISLFWLGRALSRAFASPERKVEIDAGRRRRNLGVTFGSPGAVRYSASTEQVAEEPMPRHE